MIYLKLTYGHQAFIQQCLLSIYQVQGFVLGPGIPEIKFLAPTLNELNELNESDGGDKQLKCN